MNLAPDAQGVHTQECGANLLLSTKSKSWFLGVFWRYKLDEVDVLGSSICGKDLEASVTSELHTKRRLRFFKEPVSAPQFTKCIL